MASKNAQTQQTSNGVQKAAAVGLGIAGAVAGATVGIAFANEKTRGRVVKLAKDAQDAFQRLMEALEDETSEKRMNERKEQLKETAQDLRDRADDVEKTVRKAAKSAQKDTEKRVEKVRKAVER